MILEIIINIMGYIILLVFSYNIFITLYSLKVTKNETLSMADKNTFTILIPCHNEEEVIESTLEAINNTSYNKSLYALYVIADNCSDSTVEVCNNYLNKYPDFNGRVLEVKGGSKPKALNSAVNILKKEGLWNKDNIVIIDADNKVSPTIFNSFNTAHINGFKLVQCAIRSLNDNSFVAKGFTSAFNNMNRGFQYARNRIGLSGSLSGTGFSINRKIWDEVDFVKCDTLTEDLEFSILSILQGHKIKFLFDDYVLNQHLDEFKPSFIQRVRWSRGHTQVFFKLSWSVIKNFFKHPSLQLIDSFLFISSPLRNILYVIVIALEIDFHTFVKISFWFMLIPIIYSLVFAMLADRWKLKYFFPHIAFTITMFFATAYGAITFKNKVWAKTVHKKIELPTELSDEIEHQSRLAI